jgi:hypothetical protein
MRAMATTLAAVAALVAGCGDDDDSNGAAATVPAGEPLVVYERAGGVGYTAQRMVIEEDGTATVTIEGPGEIGAEFGLSEPELAELHTLLDRATFANSEPSDCADCYAYEISHGGETATFAQTSYPPGMEPLVKSLSEIVERETPSGPARGAGK